MVNKVISDIPAKNFTKIQTQVREPTPNNDDFYFRSSAQQT